MRRVSTRSARACSWDRLCSPVAVALLVWNTLGCGGGRDGNQPIPRRESALPAATRSVAADVQSEGAPPAKSEAGFLAVDTFPGYGGWAELRSLHAQPSWRQIEGPPVLGGASFDADVLRFRMVGFPGTLGKFGFRTVWPDEAPVYAFTLRSPSVGGSASGAPGLPGHAPAPGAAATTPIRAEISPVRPAPGWPRAVVGEHKLVDCGDSKARVSWQLARKPPESAAQFVDENACVTSFRPDIGGQYFIEERISGNQLHLVAGTRLSDADCSRSACHPTLVAEMRKTVHADACWGCHATGFFYTSNDASVCASCHPATWRDVATPVSEAHRWPQPELERPECARCHSAEGHRAWLLAGVAHVQAPRPSRRDPDRGAPHACVSCHNPHDGAVRGRCGDCHLSERARAEGAADCAACHDAHTLLVAGSAGACTRGSIGPTHMRGL